MHGGFSPFPSTHLWGETCFSRCRDRWWPRTIFSQCSYYKLHRTKTEIDGLLMIKGWCPLKKHYLKLNQNNCVSVLPLERVTPTKLPTRPPLQHLTRLQNDKRSLNPHLRVFYLAYGYIIAVIGSSKYIKLENIPIVHWEIHL